MADSAIPTPSASRTVGSAAAPARDRARLRTPVLRSIRTRLALIFFLITLLAVAVIYVVVAPPLTTSLQNESIHGLQQRAEPYVALNSHLASLRKPTDQPSKRTEEIASLYAGWAAKATGSQVSIFDVAINRTGTQALEAVPLAGEPADPPNEAGQFADQVASDGVKEVAALGGVGLAGFPFPRNASLVRVVVFSNSLNDVGGAVSLVRSRILLAAAVALLVALLTGVLVARALTVRLLRLERIAQRVAIGDFSAHFSDSSSDELGRLAQALAHMQSQLEGLDDARRRFIATASHELRTPIFSLGGFLELIQDEELDDQTRRQFVGQVREQVERLGKLATQLLDLTRLESGAVQLAPTTTDLGVLARSVSSEFVPALAQHDSSLDLRLPPDALLVSCDAERVAQVLRILIDNAIVHTASGTTVRVSVARAADGEGARLSVNDAGPGIPTEAAERVFEPFYSADGTRGAGLGLAIARELALQMAARLEVQSAPGDTTFTFVLPDV
jgi:two-component system, OmpR family, sensor kinase